MSKKTTVSSSGIRGMGNTLLTYTHWLKNDVVVRAPNPALEL